jgi:hypothetical protein
MTNAINISVNIGSLNRYAPKLTIRRSLKKEFTVEVRSSHQPELMWPLIKHAPIKNPNQLWEVILTCKNDCGLEFGYQDIINQLAKLDWIVAAVLAKKIGVTVPRVPTLKLFQTQHSLRSILGVSIAVSWNYEWHYIKLSFEKWIRLLNGETQFKSSRYGADGQILTAHWRLNVNATSQIFVPTCWEGSFRSANSLKGPMVDSYDLAILTLESLELPEQVSEKSEGQSLTATFMIPQKHD